MKYFIFSLMLCLGLTTKADLKINFLSSYGVFDNDGTSPLLAGGEQALFQLIYAGSNGVVDGPALTGGVLSPGDDQILFQSLGPVAVAGDFTTEFGTLPDTLVEQAGINGGFVFGRIFQDNTASAGSFYWEGALGSIPNVNLGGVPAPLSTNYDVAGISDNGIANLQVQVIPEPTTIAVLLMGILGLVGYRKHLRK